MSKFPKFLSVQFAYDMSELILDGFNRHDRIFREANLDAMQSFESQNRVGIHEHIKGRIEYSDDRDDDRVKGRIVSLADKCGTFHFDSEIWQQVKLPKGVVPSLFSYPQHLRFINKQTTLSNERISE